MADMSPSEQHLDPKQLRKLRQQQLQQKFRQEMEAKKLQQERQYQNPPGQEPGTSHGRLAFQDAKDAFQKKQSIREDCFCKHYYSMCIYYFIELFV